MGSPVTATPLRLVVGFRRCKLVRTLPLGGEFDGKALYRFSITDEESGVEVYGQDLHISLMIADEF